MTIKVTISLERFFFFLCYESVLALALYGHVYVLGLAACGFESLPLCGFL